MQIAETGAAHACPRGSQPRRSDRRPRDRPRLASHAPAVSLRVRRGPFSQPPWQRVPTASGVPRPTARRVCAARPRSTRFEPAPHQGTVTHPFLAYSSPSRSPDPGHLAVLALSGSGFVRAAPTLPGTTRIRLPSAPPPRCDKISGEGLSPPLEPLRLTAFAHAPAHLRHHDARRRRGPDPCPDRHPPPGTARSRASRRCAI
jgi:hypothetical protein